MAFPGNKWDRTPLFNRRLGMLVCLLATADHSTSLAAELPNFKMIGMWEGYYDTPGPINYTQLDKSYKANVLLHPGAFYCEIPGSYRFRFESYYKPGDIAPIVAFAVNSDRWREFPGPAEDIAKRSYLVGTFRTELEQGDVVTTELIQGRLFGGSKGVKRTLFQGQKLPLPRDARPRYYYERE